MKLKRWFMSALLPIFMAAFPIVLLYSNNADEVALREVLPSLALFEGLALTAYLVLSICTRTPSKAAICSGILTFVYANYAILEKVLLIPFPRLQYWHTTAIFLMVTIVLFYFIITKLDVVMAGEMSKVGTLVFAGLVLLNGVLALPNAVKKMRVDATQPVKTAVAHENLQMPNVYYLLFDEFASYNQIKEYYHYDNKQLTSFLSDNAFVVSYNSYNDSTSTTTVTANLVNYDYIVTKEATELEKQEFRKQGKLFQLFREKGYQVFGLSQEAPNYGLKNIAAQSEEGSQTAGVTMGGETFSDLIVQQTVVYPFWSFSTTKAFESILNDLNFLVESDCNWEAPTLIFSHFVFPHPPFLCDKNGNTISPKDYWNWNDMDVYLGQYMYCSAKIEEIVGNILEKDPDCIIVLQSDHGARANTEHNVSFPLEVQKNIFNAVYYRGEPIDEIIGQSGVNTVRRILNRLFDMDYEVLEVPS